MMDEIEYVRENGTCHLACWPSTLSQSDKGEMGVQGEERRAWGGE